MTAAPPSEQHAQAVDNAAALRVALARIGAHDAHLLHLVYVERMRLDGVADVLGEAVPAVRLRLGRAMIDLGRALLGDDDGPRS